GCRSAYPFPGFRRCASLASPYLPSSLAGEALPPPSDIGSGPRAERDFNPPDASTVRHTLWRSPTSHVGSSSATAPHLPDADQVGTWPVVRRGISQVPTRSVCA